MHPNDGNHCNSLTGQGESLLETQPFPYPLRCRRSQDRGRFRPPVLPSPTVGRPSVSADVGTASLHRGQGRPSQERKKNARGVSSVRGKPRFDRPTATTTASLPTPKGANLQLNRAGRKGHEKARRGERRHSARCLPNRERGGGVVAPMFFIRHRRLLLASWRRAVDAAGERNAPEQTKIRRNARRQTTSRTAGSISC